MRRAVFAIVSTVVGLVLLLSFKTHPLPAGGPVAANGQGAGPATAGHPSRPRTARHTVQHAAAEQAARAVRTMTGGVAETPYGPVQVQLTIRANRITRARAVQVPSGTSLDQQINSYAIPHLDQETLQAQSANIDMVSGATYTSEGYLSSLQNALDRARLR